MGFARDVDDSALIQIVDAATAEAARISGAWLLCRPGCAECCRGQFEISQLDASRLRRGLKELERSDAVRAVRVKARAHAAVARLHVEDDDEPCPALDPATQTCDLYAFRPMTCRLFGPPLTYGEEGVSTCELCFVGASDEEIAACAVDVEMDALEADLNRRAEEAAGVEGTTVVALCLVD